MPDAQLPGAQPIAPLQRGTITRYAFGSFGTGGFATLPGLVLVYYLTDSLAVAPLWAGLVIATAKAWDIVLNPIIGALSDRALRFGGSRRPLMLLGALALPVFFILTFAVPHDVAPSAAAIWVLLAFLLATTGFSLFQVPYIALPAEIAAGYDERTRLLTWRVVLLAVAILLFGAGGPALRAAAGGGYAGYLVMACAAAAVISIGMLIACTIAPRQAPQPRDAGERGNLVATVLAQYRSSFGVLRTSQPFRVLLAAFVLQGMATGEMLAGASYVATWVIGSEAAVTPLFVALIGPALVCTPLWGLLAGRIGKERTFRLASLLFALAAASLVLQIWLPGAWLYPAVGLCGAAYAAMQSLPMAMLPDTISDDARRHGPGRAGIFGGIWTAGETAGMAAGAALFAVALMFGEYRQHAGDAEVVQGDAAVAAIIIGFSVVPAILVGLSLWPLARYGLRREDIDHDHA